MTPPVRTTPTCGQTMLAFGALTAYLAALKLTPFAIIFFFSLLENGDVAGGFRFLGGWLCFLIAVRFWERSET